MNDAKKIICLAILLLAPSGLVATEVYRWVDENGVVNFSQTAPPVTTAEVDTIRLRDSGPGDNAASEDIYNVAQQQERMKALREEREKQRQERLERQRREAARVVVQPREVERMGYPIYWNPGLRPPPPIDPPVRPLPGPGDPIEPPGMIKPPAPLRPR